MQLTIHLTDDLVRGILADNKAMEPELDFVQFVEELLRQQVGMDRLYPPDEDEGTEGELEDTTEEEPDTLDESTTELDANGT